MWVLVGLVVVLIVLAAGRAWTIHRRWKPGHPPDDRVSQDWLNDHHRL
jgi:hypothetical protein